MNEIDEHVEIWTRLAEGIRNQTLTQACRQRTSSQLRANSEGIRDDNVSHGSLWLTVRFSSLPRISQL